MNNITFTVFCLSCVPVSMYGVLITIALISFLSTIATHGHETRHADGVGRKSHDAIAISVSRMPSAIFTPNWLIAVYTASTTYIAYWVFQ